MSRIGKKPVLIPTGVDVRREGNVITVSGPLGSISRPLPPETDVELGEAVVRVKSVGASRKRAAYWGLARSLIAGMVEGVFKGFEKRLEIEGIGYRFTVEDGRSIRFSLGFSHPVEFEAPSGINFRAEKNTLVVSGIDKELVGRVAAQIRGLKPPEPYKGKGIRYQGEVIRRKAGKKAVSSAG